MDINYEYYKVFYYVVKYKNITKAAQALHNNQPNITRIIKLLEQELNTQLLIRTNRGITLTEAGEKLYSRVKIACEQIQMAEDELLSQGTDDKGTIVIGTIETALHLYMFSFFKDFHKKYPHIRLKIHNYTTLQALKELQNNALDMIIISTPFQLPKEFSKIKLRSFHDMIIAGSEYDELTERKYSLKELVKYPWVTVSKDTATYQAYNQIFLDEGLILEPDIEVATTDLILPMIKNNLGIGYVPADFAYEAIQKGDVFQVHCQQNIKEREICMVYDNKRNLSYGAKLLRQYIMKGQDNDS